ncbi:Lrp/AsnC family transcriptional regulator [Agromyces marinus]|uniref:Transcriptional regulator, AsnC family protein n=1 Tax=Agromyces marinus TaxID=1389020 RepID=A0ABM8GXB2_9MICO|nr:Lrp/AsnC family transcriptional regulator [Agromyces marinus]UIP58611.1 DNA-binding transcriptional activator DecR [Agromyces marinus]BDZ53106.1 putative transcriptional regulator, AsnC family protein [Agromyces marinus]
MAQKPELDRVDRALLTALSANARASGAALAAEVGVAESTVSLRLRRLQSLGTVRGYRVDVDLSSVGVSLQALIAVRLVKHDRKEIDAFRNAVPHLPGVLSVFHMAGAEDYLLHVAARDSEELRQFVLAHLTGHPAVSHTETNLIFEHAEGDGWQKLVG